MDAQVLYAQYVLQIAQEDVPYAIAIVVFAVLDVVLQDATDVIALLAVAQVMFVILVAQYVTALHADAIYEHALHVITLVIIFAKYEITLNIFFWINF